MIIESRLLGRLIRKKRINKSIKQNQLAKSIGCSAQFLGRIEKEEVPIPEKFLIELIHELKLSERVVRKIFVENYILKAQSLFERSSKSN